MSIALIFYLIAAVLFAIAAFGWRPGNALPAGQLAFVLGHILAGVAFKAV